LPWMQGLGALGRALAAWCVAHYRLAAGRIVRIEQHDCYEQPSAPADGGAALP
jgi:hypothetical protein